MMNATVIGLVLACGLGAPMQAQDSDEHAVQAAVEGFLRLAYLRADFQVMREGKAQASGVDQVTLVRAPAGWKIAAITYTSMPVR